MEQLEETILDLTDPDYRFNLSMPEVPENKETCNVLLLALSTFPFRAGSFYHLKDEKEKQKYYYQLEPVPQVLARELAEKGDCIDQVIMLCTKAVSEKQKKIKFSNGTESVTAEQYFVKRVTPLLNPNRKEEEKFISVQVDESENNLADSIKNTVSELRKLKRNYKNVNLYIDEHGGFRGFQLTLEAIISLIRNEIEVKEIFTVHGRDDVYTVEKSSEAFEIFDFVAGMNEFINYGRIDSLKRYYARRDKVKPSMLTGMETVAEGLKLCDTKRYEEGLELMKQELQEKATDPYFEIFKDQIAESYGQLLQEENIDAGRKLLDTIRWCAKKGFLQQALTYIEDRMPEFFLEYSHFITVASYEFDARKDDEKREIIKGTQVNWQWYENDNQLKFYKLFTNLKANDEKSVQKDCITYLLEYYLENAKEFGEDLSPDEKDEIQEYLMSTVITEGLAHGMDEHFLKAFNLNRFEPYVKNKDGFQDVIMDLKSGKGKKKDEKNIFADFDGKNFVNEMLEQYFQDNAQNKYKVLFLLIKKMYGGKLTEEEAKIYKTTYEGMLHDYFLDQQGEYEVNPNTGFSFLACVKTDFSPERRHKVMKETGKKYLYNQKRKKKKGEDVEAGNKLIEKLFQYFGRGYGEFSVAPGKYSYDESTLLHIFHSMESTKDREPEFIENYIDYRVKQARFEQEGKYVADYLDEYGIYYEFLNYLEQDKGTKLFVIKHALRRGNEGNGCSWAGLTQSPFTYNILKNEQVIGDTSGNQPEAEYCFEIKINDNVNREKLDVVLRLHDALKKERNNCNHASDKGPRVPSEDVKKLICSYVDLCEQLLEESGCSPLHTKA